MAILHAPDGIFCDDPAHVRPSSRLEFLFVGLVGGLGLTLGNYLSARASAAATQSPGQMKATAQSLIHIFLPGGMSAHESFDPKPDAPIESKGPFGTVKTNLDGEVYSELMKDTAKVADKITVCRSMTHGEAAHERGTHNMFTGYRPSPAIQYPSFGSVVSHEYGPRNNMPPYVAVPSIANDYAGSGFLSSESDALKEKYGKTSAGMRMLMARRLVEAGVRFVSLTYGSWDHHTGISKAMNSQLPSFDKAFAALINDLEERKMLDSTLIMVSTEFGRTPKVNK